MSDDTLHWIADTKEQAHAIARQVYANAQVMILNGQRVRVTVDEAHDEIGARQRRFFHGPVLTQIAEKVRMPDGSRYVVAAWKEFYRQMFLPDRWVMRKQPRWDAKQRRMVEPKRATPHRERQSTEDLGVKGYSDLIDKVTAHAATELGVEFDFDAAEREGVRYVRPVRKAKVEEAATC